VRRVSVVGTSGSGKTTLSRKLATALDVPMLELDSVFHQTGWTELPVEEFRRRVSAFVTGADGWVVDGNYSAVRDLVWARADTVVWFDLPRYEVMRRLSWRTARRGALGVELWNGNRESLRNFFSRDPERSILAWAWATHRRNRERYRAAAVDPAWSHLEFVRVAGPNDIQSLLQGVPT
jgi:adenylate kinase family enzyme